MPYEPGRLLLVAYPFTDRTAAKQRPVLVVSAKRFNRREDFVGLPVSSRIIPDDPHGIVILNTDKCFPLTKLRRSSTVEWTKPMTLSSSVVDKKLGKVPPEILEGIQTRVRSLFS